MKIQVDKHAALAAAKRMERFAKKKNASGILGHIKVEALESTVRFSAGVGDPLFASVDVDCQVEEVGGICIEAANLVRLIESASDGVIDMSVEWPSFRVASNQRIASVGGLPMRDFPAVPPLEDWRPFDLAAFRAALGHVVFAASTDDTRINLAVVHFEPSELASSDGHRLALACAETPFRGNIPRRLCIEWLALRGNEAEYFADATHVAIRSDGSILAGKLGTATFPPYRKVVPEKCDQRGKLPREPAIEAIRAAVSCAPEKTPSLRLTFSKESLRIEADDTDHGRKMAGSISCTCDGTLEIGINGNYLAEALEHLHGEEVEFELQGGVDPIVLKSETTTHVVMAMRI